MKQTRQTKKMTPEMVKELLELRKIGWSFPRLGRKFGIDHTTAVYHCKKAKLKIIKILPTIFNSDTKKEILSSEKINLGKNYIDYLKIQAKKDGKDYKKYLRYL